MSRRIDKREFFAKGFQKASMRAIAHDPDEDAALEHMSALRDFYTAGWYQILGIG